MRAFNLSYVLGALMVLTFICTVVVTPSRAVSVTGEIVRLKEMIPEQIPGWKVDPDVVPLQVSPEVQTMLNSLYSDTLVRTYISPDGERVMLSLAYGGDQSGNLALHKPETCYGAQGFEISQFSRDDFISEAWRFPVTHLLAVRGQRSEPITYWTTVGDKVVRNGVEQKLQKLRYAMTGKIPDGILVRVSTIDPDPAHSYRIQNTFIQSMLASMTRTDRDRIIGKIGQ